MLVSIVYILRKVIPFLKSDHIYVRKRPPTQLATTSARSAPSNVDTGDKCKQLMLEGGGQSFTSSCSETIGYIGYTRSTLPAHQFPFDTIGHNFHRSYILHCPSTWALLPPPPGLENIWDGAVTFWQCFLCVSAAFLALWRLFSKTFICCILKANIIAPFSFENKLWRLRNYRKRPWNQLCQQIL